MLTTHKYPSEWTNLSRWWQKDFRLLPGFVQENVGDVGVRLVLLHEIHHMIIGVTTSLHTFLPFLVLAAVGIHHNPSILQRLQFFGLKITATTRSQPKILRITAGAYDSCLLALNDANRLVGITRQQMQAEENLFSFSQLRSDVLSLADRAHRINPITHSMTITAISHQLGIMHPALLVYQPKHNGWSIIDTILDHILLRATHIIVDKHPSKTLAIKETWLNAILRQPLQPTAKGTCAPHRFLSPGHVKEHRLMSFLENLPLLLHHQSPSSGQAQKRLPLYKLHFIHLPAIQPGMVMEKFSRWIMIATRCHMVALATFIGHISARLQIHISREALLPATLGTNVSVGSARTIALQHISNIYRIVHACTFLSLIIKYQSVSKCIISVSIQKHT